MTDWRLPENRREVFQRFYTAHLAWKAHPGCVYSLLPAIAQEGFDPEWIVWLNGNTQNPVTTWILLQEAPTPQDWQRLEPFFNANWDRLQWDTDRRYQKAKFLEATERWRTFPRWPEPGAPWDEVWAHARSLPFMGRLSAWSMSEYARILMGSADADTLYLRDGSGSRSHRNGLAILAGMPWESAPYLQWADTKPYVTELEWLGADLLREAQERNPGEADVSYLTLESALCTYKSWHKPDRRYPGVYADMAYGRITWAEERWPEVDFGLFWQARERDLPEFLRAELGSESITRAKQNQYRETGIPVNLGLEE